MFDLITQKKEELEQIKKDVESKLQRLEVIESEISENEKEIKVVVDSIDSTLGNFVEKDEFVKFFQKPYAIIPHKKNSVLVAVPKFIKNFQVGWLWKETESFYIYQLDQYSSWLGDVPIELLNEIDIKKEFDAQIIDDYVYFDTSEKEVIKKAIGKHLADFSENSARIVKGHEFEIIADMVERGNLPFKPNKIADEDLREGKSDIKLRPYQKPAYDKFLETGAVGLFHPTGAGKSIVAMKCFDIIKGDKLILAPSRTLIEQWAWYINKYIPHLKDEIDLCTYQGFKNRDKKYAMAVYDECLIGGTEILMEDGRLKKIENVRGGDKVFGGEVKNTFSKFVKNTIKIRCSNSILETTTTHPNLAIRKSSLVMDKHKNQYRPLKGGNVETILSKDLCKGDFLLTPKKIPHTTLYNWSKEQLGFVALIMCDGHIDKKSNMIRVSVSKDKNFFRDIFKKGCESFGCKYKENENSRGDLNLWVISPELKMKLMEIFEIPSGKKSDIIKINNQIFNSPLESIKTFIDYCICCEGWINNLVNFSTTSKDFAMRFNMLLKKFGVGSSFTIKKRKNKDHKTLYQVHFRKWYNISMERKNLANLKTHRRSFERVVEYCGVEYIVTKILEITQNIEEKTVYDFTTKSHSFIANGVLTHNCHKLPANTFSRLAVIDTKYRLGLSASPNREDKRERYIFALTGFPVGLNWKDYMKETGKSYHPINVHIVRTGASKMQKVFNLVDMKKKTLIFCDSLELGKRIATLLNIPFIHGETKDRLEIIEKNKVMVCSRVLDLGVSIKDLQRIIEVDFLFGSRQQELQRTGRLMHSNEKDVRHDIIFTEKEIESYGKRLFALQEKGFAVKIHSS